MIGKLDRELTNGNTDERSYLVENYNGWYEENKGEFGDVLDTIREGLEQLSACEEKKKKGVK